MVSENDESGIEEAIQVKNNVALFLNTFLPKQCPNAVFIINAHSTMEGKISYSSPDDPTTFSMSLKDVSHSCNSNLYNVRY